VTEEANVSQLYVVVEAGPTASDRLQAALDAAEVASVLITAAPGAALDAASAVPLIAIARKAGAAALIADDADLARAVKADGVHLVLRSSPEPLVAYQAARRIVGQGAVVGVDAGTSRDDAMTLAEAGADYVAFSAPAHMQDRDEARAERDVLTQWWAEIFQVPCVAFDVETAEEARALAEVRADFVAVRLPTGRPAASARDLVEAIAGALAAREVAVSGSSP
jgi:thiamine-phosphate pyrophosphorylase